MFVYDELIGKNKLVEIKGTNAFLFHLKRRGHLYESQNKLTLENLNSINQTNILHLCCPAVCFISTKTPSACALCAFSGIFLLLPTDNLLHEMDRAATFRILKKKKPVVYRIFKTISRTLFMYFSSFRTAFLEARGSRQD